MHTVVETPNYLAEAKRVGMSEAKQVEVVDIIAADPEHGEVVPGTGGCRKFRVGGRGNKGKSGSYRIWTFFCGPDLPVFLLTVFDKGDKDNLSKAERNALAKLVKALERSYRDGLRPTG